MCDVLRDNSVTEFLQAQWREATSYRQEEILQAIEDFVFEKTGFSTGVKSDEDDFEDDVYEDDDDFDGEEITEATASKLVNTIKALLSELRKTKTETPVVAAKP